MTNSTQPSSPLRVSPDLAGFKAAGADNRVVPVHATVLADTETPLSVYRRIALGRPGGFLLESAQHGTWSRYSFIGRNPVATLTADDDELVWLGTVPHGAPTTGDPIAATDAVLRLLRSAEHPELPPMISSLVGYLGWDAVRRFERLGTGPEPVDRLPLLSLSIPGDVVIVDHYTSELTLVANVINVDGEDTGIEEAYASGVARLHTLLDDLRTPAIPEVVEFTPAAPNVRSLTPKEDYLESVQTAQRRIIDGDIFQVVLGQRFESDCAAAPLDVYRALRRTNPSPYMYLMDVQVPGGDSFALIGSSPEALVTVENGRLATHPIAGSRPRGDTTAADTALAAELIADEKERAEHLMLVDLARNDLAKVCTPGTVDVTQFMEIERFSHIMHISSTVTGDLVDDATGIDVLRAAFPAGTLSGAPKPMALQIIDELEPVARGVYGGVVGYLSFSGDLDMAITIRTGVLHDGVLSVYAGAGIVADSVPETEYEETENKAAAVLRAGAAATALSQVASGLSEDTLATGDSTVGSQAGKEIRK